MYICISELYTTEIKYSKQPCCHLISKDKLMCQIIKNYKYVVRLI